MNVPLFIHPFCLLPCRPKNQMNKDLPSIEDDNNHWSRIYDANLIYKFRVQIRSWEKIITNNVCVSLCTLWLAKSPTHVDIMFLMRGNRQLNCFVEYYRETVPCLPGSYRTWIDWERGGEGVGGLTCRLHRIIAQNEEISNIETFCRSNCRSTFPFAATAFHFNEFHSNLYTFADYLVLVSWFGGGVPLLLLSVHRIRPMSSIFEWTNIGIYYWISAKITRSTFLICKNWKHSSQYIDIRRESCGGTFGYCCVLLATIEKKVNCEEKP